MKKLVIIHDRDWNMTGYMMHIITHHIRCPTLAFVGGTGMLEYHPEPVLELDVATTAVANANECAVLFVTNDPFISARMLDYEKKFNIFNIWTDPLAFHANQNKHGVWIPSIEEIPYAFLQMVNWIYDV